MARAPARGRADRSSKGPRRGFAVGVDGFRAAAKAAEQHRGVALGDLARCQRTARPVPTGDAVERRKDERRSELRIELVVELAGGDRRLDRAAEVALVSVAAGSDGPAPLRRE